MTDYSKHKKAVSKYKVWRILDNPRSWFLRVYRTLSVGGEEKIVATQGVMLDGFVYLWDGDIFGLFSPPTDNYLRYKIDTETVYDMLAYFEVSSWYNEVTKNYFLGQYR